VTEHKYALDLNVSMNRVKEALTAPEDGGGGIPDAQRTYGEHNGKKLTCYPEGLEAALDAFLRFKGAVFVDGKPVDKFGVATAAMSAAVQAYLDFYRKGVGETNG